MVKMFASTTVILQFIGLCTFSNQVEPGKRMVIMPRPTSWRHHLLQHEESRPIAQISRPGKGPSRGYVPLVPVEPIMIPEVEPHVALIAFPSGMWDPLSSTWKATALASLAGYDYVALDGERVTLRSIGVAPPETTELPQQLPSLQKCCQTMGSGLNAAFRAPGYSGASAVIDIPRGSLSSCMVKKIYNSRDLNAEPVFISGRIDTHLTLPTNGKRLLIHGTKNGVSKTLQLDLTRAPGAGNIMFINAPARWVLKNDHSTKTAPGELSHSFAFYDMGDRKDVKRGAKCQTLAECLNGRDFQPCGSTGSALKTEMGTSVVVISNPDCSNSQWP